MNNISTAKIPGIDVPMLSFTIGPLVLLSSSIPAFLDNSFSGIKPTDSNRYRSQILFQSFIGLLLSSTLQ